LFNALGGDEDPSTDTPNIELADPAPRGRMAHMSDLAEFTDGVEPALGKRIISRRSAVHVDHLVSGDPSYNHVMAASHEGKFGNDFCPIPSQSIAASAPKNFADLRRRWMWMAL
jgi:hypothetical protein